MKDQWTTLSSSLSEGAKLHMGLDPEYLSAAVSAITLKPLGRGEEDYATCTRNLIYRHNRLFPYSSALCLLLGCSYYAKNYADIMGSSLPT